MEIKFRESQALNTNFLQFINPINIDLTNATNVKENRIIHGKTDF